MNSIVPQLLLQVILIFLNAFFAAAEIAVISLNATKLRKSAEDGDKTCARLLKLVEEPSGFLSTIQIGITLAGFLGSAFAADNFSGYLVNWVYQDLGFHALPVSVLDTLSVIVITIILSYFTLIFGELVPKRIAMQKSFAVAKFVYRVVSFVALIMKPAVAFLSLSTNVVLKLFGMKTEAEEETVTEEEIRLMVELGEENGCLLYTSSYHAGSYSSWCSWISMRYFPHRPGRHGDLETVRFPGWILSSGIVRRFGNRGSPAGCPPLWGTSV